MILGRASLLCGLLAGVFLSACANLPKQEPGHAPDLVFEGSTPGQAGILGMLGIPADSKSELLEWHLRLIPAERAGESGAYELRVEHGMTVQNHPGIGADRNVLERRGDWRVSRGTALRPDASVYELTGLLSLFLAGENVLQIMNPDRTLMVGNAGWSFTLNRREAIEKPADPFMTAIQPTLSYSISTKASGPAVFGIFEGRTPGLGIAALLGVAVHPGTTKAKWRVTLFKDPESGMPARYKIEGSLYYRGAREGSWNIDPDGTYRLKPPVSGPGATEPDILLMPGDDRVLFFLDTGKKATGTNPATDGMNGKARLLTGGAEFSYTLNRVETAPTNPGT